MTRNNDMGALPRRHRISKASYEEQLPLLRDQLLDVQAQLRKTQASAIALIVTGVPAAGQSETINQLLEWLDPKHVGVCAFDDADREDQRRPSLWRYWQSLPARGRMSFYFGGWYQDYLAEALHRSPSARKAARRTAQRIRRLEAMLHADRVTVVKIHLHIDRKTQAKRLKRLRADKLTRWRVTREDRRLAAQHPQVARVYRHCLDATHHADAPWHLVDGTDEEYRLLTVGRILLEAMTKALEPPKTSKRRTEQAAPTRTPAVKAPDERIDDDFYEHELQVLQARLALLVRNGSFKKHALVLAFEGMDAAGKGGAIRRITQVLDARQYQVVPVSAPTPEELQYPYLWRFWRRIPPLGSITIFDRSWYGRVLVERVRGFAAAADWERAYDEIREFELQLTEHGIVVVKFWLSVSKREQLKRFKSRDKDPLKRFKLDREDWVNRRHYDAYQRAATDMIRRTHRPEAPWVSVAADDKKHARLSVLHEVCEALERS